MSKNLNTISQQDSGLNISSQEQIVQSFDEINRQSYSQNDREMCKSSVLQTQLVPMTLREFLLKEEIIINNNPFCEPAPKSVTKELPKRSPAPILFSNQFIRKAEINKLLCS
ncbi:unnamed protein product [Paramecium octaurelia]|uniref:Uncharacterized protein n=1 Tax=Paramecium octaurelia TaxID=43137 RepID=A0A8S1UYD1_PAROT|nr:unnamed protein product [Paramecium octaurelia]